MGLFEFFERGNLKKDEETGEQTVVFEGAGSRDYRGYKVCPIITYLSYSDRRYLDNARKLQSKYGDDLYGAHIKITNILCDNNETAQKGSNVLKIEVDGLRVGTIYDGSDEYNKIMTRGIEGAYCRVEEQIEMGSSRSERRFKLQLYVKYKKAAETAGQA